MAGFASPVQRQPRVASVPSFRQQAVHVYDDGGCRESVSSNGSEQNVVTEAASALAVQDANEE